MDKAFFHWSDQPDSLYYIGIVILGQFHHDLQWYGAFFALVFGIERPVAHHGAGKLLGELAHLNVVPAQPGEVFHEHRRDVPGLDCGEHFLKAGALHGGSGDAVIHKKDGVSIAFLLGNLLENLLLRQDSSRFFLRENTI